MRIILWMYCIEASAGIYESTGLEGQGSPGYIWQSTIHISTTTKYTITVLSSILLYSYTPHHVFSQLIA